LKKRSLWIPEQYFTAIFGICKFKIAQDTNAFVPHKKGRPKAAFDRLAG
jgi:hypothetical protein